MPQTRIEEAALPRPGGGTTQAATLSLGNAGIGGPDSRCRFVRAAVPATAPMRRVDSTSPSWRVRPAPPAMLPDAPRSRSRDSIYDEVAMTKPCFMAKKELNFSKPFPGQDLDSQADPPHTEASGGVLRPALHGPWLAATAMQWHSHDKGMERMTARERGLAGPICPHWRRTHRTIPGGMVARDARPDTQRGFDVGRT